MTSKNVYDRLYDKRSYTGVYRKRFEGDGRINGDTQLSMMRNTKSSFEGDTNTGTNETIHTISTIMRPNLRYDEKKTRRKSLGKTTAHASPHIQKKDPVRRNSLPISGNSSVMPPPAPTGSASTAKPGPDPYDPHTLLKYVFQYYCRFGRTGARGRAENTLDNANFSKFCRDCPGLIDEKFTKTSADLIFVKAKKKGLRRLNYSQFLDAFGIIALQKYPDQELARSVPCLLENHVAGIPCLQAALNSTSSLQVESGIEKQVAEVKLEARKMEHSTQPPPNTLNINVANTPAGHSTMHEEPLPLPPSGL